MRTTFLEFVDKANKTHLNKFTYIEDGYSGVNSKLKINCSKHGIFEQRGMDHLKGRGCNKCAIEARADSCRDTLEGFINKANIKHNNRYDYSKFKYTNSLIPGIIICREHGEYKQAPAMHLRGEGCPKCSYILRSNNLKDSFEDFVRKANIIHNTIYEYVKIYYGLNEERFVDINCKIHGTFTQSTSNHLSGCICPKCAYGRNGILLRLSKEEFIDQVNKVYGNYYDYRKTIYNGMTKPLIVTCPKHGDFEIIASHHVNKCGCTKCSNSGTSSLELTLINFFDRLKIEYIHRKKLALDDKTFEVDFLIPSKNVAIEVDGKYWHSELAGKDNHAHLNKTILCEKLGISLKHIFETEFNDLDLLYSRLQNIVKPELNKKIFARKCIIKEITDKSIKSSFLKNNHMQGNDNSQICLGLYNDDILVSMMTFSKKRKCFGFKDSKGWELVRFCSLKYYNIIGAAGKLLKYFENTYHPVEIITYADRRWSNGHLYTQIGFNLSHASDPSYWYFNGNILYHRFSFRKNILNQKLVDFNPNITEWENMKNNGYNRIWDCGTFVFKKLAKS